MPDDPPTSPEAPRRWEEEELSDGEDVEDAQHSLLRSSRSKKSVHEESKSYEMTAKGRFRAYWLGVVVCIGGFLCKRSLAVAASQRTDIEQSATTPGSSAACSRSNHIKATSATATTT